MLNSKAELPLRGMELKEIGMQEICSERPSKKLYVYTFILYAEDEKSENEQPPAFLPFSHPHATIIGHLPHQRLYD